MPRPAASAAATDPRCPSPVLPPPDGPTIAGLLSTAPAPAPRGATRLWPGEPLLWSWGPWHPGEVRTVQCAHARLAAVGQCLADEVTMRHDLRRAVQDGRWERLTRWPGAYLLIVVQDDGRLTAYADPAGQFPLYYGRHGQNTVLSTRARTAAALCGAGGRPDTAALAAHIVCPAVPELTEGRTAYDGIRRLGGGQALRVTPSGDRTHWIYEDLAPDPGTRFEDSAVQLRSALTRAVTLRTDTAPRITSDFSGGLDSTSLAFLTARTTSRPPLDAFVYHHPDAPAGDLANALAHAEQTPSVRLAVTRGSADSLPYSGLPGHGPADQPDPAAVIGARQRLRLDHIARGGPGIHLTGEGGDALLAAPPSYLGDIAATAGLRRLLSDGRALARIRQLSPADVILRARRLARTPLHQAMSELASHLDEPLDHPPRWADAVAWWPAPGPETAWLTTRARRHLAELAEERARATDPAAAPVTPGIRAVLCELRTSAAVQAQFTATARAFGIWPHAPFLDSEVVRACTRLPLAHRIDPFAAKPLLAAALTGLVPDPVLRRRTKGDYAAENYHGVRRSATQIRARLLRSPLAELGIIEPSRVIASVERAVAGLAAPFPALNRLLGADLWLTADDSGRERS
ncbi:albusnodin/ikarugamycin family macrolactam cyclase [Streptomyces sp. BG9H]|uniref:asparagine synthase (glutamine-hydrolyzing) n=1 Tax=Streptomyces anatolicus TaxID=2675858 RepID=A0ABS6YF90_9ACTN|nr:albusnodin/ikarugamycin family macrolactam cyclase [Streptomyces anatolicus]MBW5420078.1 albusnodin/ikarugamycin family macrolactam cyclase [Streptomyces anatolicus]